MRVGLLQMTASDDPVANTEQALSLLEDAVAKGAEFVLTPEVTNCLSTSRTHQREVLRPEARDPTLAAMRGAARSHGIWLLIGSLALRTADPQGRFANRSVLLDAGGKIAARYDKIHMFDVTVSETETYRESAGFRPGTRATLAATPWGGLGMTICYDLRFPELFRRLGRAGAAMISVPSAFSTVTGVAHWETLVRARAIETGAFVLAPAQTGFHPATRGTSRATHGHSLVVAPWGEVLLDAGFAPGAYVADLDLDQVQAARAKIPAWGVTPGWEGP
ncbi:MAG: carbon-nitrogen hydrolase family protein [Pseudomonadota bacterium]